MLVMRVFLSNHHKCRLIRNYLTPIFYDITQIRIKHLCNWEMLRAEATAQQFNRPILKAVIGSLVFVKSVVRNAILACITVLPVLLISCATTLVFVKSDVRNAILACITVLPVLLISCATTKGNIKQKQKCTQNGTNCYCYIKCCEVSKNFLV